jgi:hypothetical protein
MRVLDYKKWEKGEKLSKSGERISDLNQAQLVLNSLIQKYNYQWIHSTTGEIPYLRFQRVLKENKSLFREFRIRPPYKSTKDIFCLRADRMVNYYRKVSINNLVPVKTGVRIKST